MERQRDEIVIHANNGGDAPEDSNGVPQLQARESEGTSPRAERALSIVIAATFTANSLRQPLEFWMRKLGIPARIEIAPYAQIMQELLRPDSLLSQNSTGINIILVRLEDWVRGRLLVNDTNRNIEHIKAVSTEFIGALKVLRTRTGASIFVFLCPSSSLLPAPYREAFEDIGSQTMTGLEALENVHCWTHRDLLRLYPVMSHEDIRADRLGNIPYSSEYFVAVATLLARRAAALIMPPYKVIAIDCDNTLWGGVCGEDGAAGVDLTVAHLKFQQMLIRQHDAGILLCLCSKNNASDVELVFRDRSEMLLQKEHLIAMRINWMSKSSNLQSLSKELGLSLDSFIFVDDDPVECAEVRAHCPSVLTLQFPQTPESVAHFLDHVWAFDRIGVTDEAKHRTSQYKENRARNLALETSADLDEFLASLEVEVDVSLMKPNQLSRVAELSQRTNQFNLTDIRRRPGEIEALRQMYQILVIHVRDRFGDYGLVGSLFFRCVSSWIEVDTFVLSCRVLGRGVEHRVVKELGRIARQAGMKSIILRYRATPRSGPAREFLESSFDQFRAPSGDNYNSTADMVFTIPVDYAEGLRTQLPERTVAKKSVLPAEAMREAETGGSANWHEEAYRLSNLRDLVEEIRRSALGERRTRGAYTAPRTPTESSLSRIWAEVLGIEDISMDDDLLQLGADSLQAVRAISRIAAVLGVELPLTAVFDAPTVEKLAIAVEGGNSARSAHDELAAFAQNLRHNIEEMSDAEVLAGLADLERELNSESAMNS